jgi:predicted PurR-regulated permease PerM
VIVLFTLVLVVTALYFGRVVLMPLTVAGLLTFLLGPLVDFLHRRGVPRVLSVVVVVVFAFSAIGGVGYIVTMQVMSFANDLPLYKDNIRRKVADLRGVGKGGSLQKVQEAVKDVAGEMRKDDAGKRPKEPQPVVIEPDGSALSNIATIIGPWVEPVATVFLVVVLVVFMLFERQELRNRLIRLIGYRRLTLTTKALDEASQRVSRYLLLQSVINLTFGLAVAAGLWLIGLPYALLWGLLSGVLRFIPYVGPWIAASLTITLSLAVFHGWQQPLMVMALFLVLEPLTGMVLETLIYAGSAGVSEVALLVAVAFWTWLWGPIGTLLATPLTVCLVVFAKYIPDLDFLVVLIGDQPPMTPDVSFYQRLLAVDQDEAAELVEEYFKTHERDRVYDDVLIPALNYVKRDRDDLEDEDVAFIVRATRDLVDDVGSMQTIVAAAAANGAAPHAGPRERIVGCAARNGADEVALLMLRQVLDPARFDVEVVSPETLLSDTEATAGRGRPAAIVVTALPPGGLTHARSFVKRLRARNPETRIVVGRWGARRFGEEKAETLVAAGATTVTVTLIETRDQLVAPAAIPAAPARAAEPASARAR